MHEDIFQTEIFENSKSYYGSRNNKVPASWQLPHSTQLEHLNFSLQPGPVRCTEVILPIKVPAYIAKCDYLLIYYSVFHYTSWYIQHLGSTWPIQWIWQQLHKFFLLTIGCNEQQRNSDRKKNQNERVARWKLYKNYVILKQ